MDYKKLSRDVSVAGQITTADIAALTDGGFRSIVCHRPDREAAGQPSHTEIEAIARSVGLAFRYQPVVSGRMTEADAALFAEHIAELPKPILAYCQSGARSTALLAHAQSNQLSARPTDDASRDRI